MEDDRKREDMDTPGAGREPGGPVDPMTQGTAGRPSVTPRPDGAGGGAAGTPGPGSAPAGLAGADAGRRADPLTPEDRRHLEAQRRSLWGRKGGLGGRLTSWPGVWWVAAALIILVILIAG